MQLNCQGNIKIQILCDYCMNSIFVWTYCFIYWSTSFHNSIKGWRFTLGELAVMTKFSMTKSKWQRFKQLILLVYRLVDCWIYCYWSLLVKDECKWRLVDVTIIDLNHMKIPSRHFRFFYSWGEFSLLRSWRLEPMRNQKFNAVF